MNHPPPIEPMYDVNDVAAIMNVTPRCVRGWVARDQIPHVRIPTGTVRFRPSEVSEWIDSGVRLVNPAREAAKLRHPSAGGQR